MKIGDITLKQDYLTGGQVGNLVTEAVEIYKQGGLFEDYAFNPVDMEINFYPGLFYLLIEDYEILSKFLYFPPFVFLQSLTFYYPYLKPLFI